MPHSTRHSNSKKANLREMTLERLNELQMRVVLSNQSGTGGTDFAPQHHFNGIMQGLMPENMVGLSIEAKSGNVASQVNNVSDPIHQKKQI